MTNLYGEILRLDDELDSEWVDLCLRKIESVAGPEFYEMERTERWWYSFRKWAWKDYYLCPIEELDEGEEEKYGKDTVAVVFVGPGADEFEIERHEMADIASLKRKIWARIGCQDHLENVGEYYLQILQEDIQNGFITVFPEAQ